MRLALLALLAGCVDYAHTSMHNAPGQVNLDEPFAHENGDPARYEVPSSPGVSTLAVFAMPYVMGGVGRNGGGGETGLEMRLEHSHEELLADRSLALTLGIPFVQWHGDRTINGAYYAELSYRSPLGDTVIPWDIGVGPVAYASNFEVGAQLTLRVPLVLLRLRYLPDSRFEVMVGTEIPFTFFFSRSR